MNGTPTKVLLTGATGFVGGRLLHKLTAAGIRPRCVTRSPASLQERLGANEEVEIAEADLIKSDDLDRVLVGIELAYYLVHSMGGRTLKESRAFAQLDRRAAEQFIRAAEKAGVQHIIYLGGLGETGDDLSEHLESRQHVARILQSGSPKTTVLRAANIIGAGGAPFEMIRFLVERLPVMLCPRWIDTRCQPIDIEDVLGYLLGCLETPATAGLTLDIGGPEIVTYRTMMQIYSRVRGLKRLIVSVPVLTPKLSAFWINMVTPVPAGVVYPLVEGLKNEVVCRENRIRDLITIPLTPIEISICNALQEVQQGPGKLPSRQSCFLSDSL